MHVLEAPLEFEVASRDLGFDLLQAADDRRTVGLADDAAGGQHPGVSLRSGKIFVGEAFVEIDGGVYFLHDRSGAGGKTSPPHLVRRHWC